MFKAVAALFALAVAVPAAPDTIMGSLDWYSAETVGVFDHQSVTDITDYGVKMHPANATSIHSFAWQYPGAQVLTFYTSHHKRYAQVTGPKAQSYYGNCAAGFTSCTTVTAWVDPRVQLDGRIFYDKGSYLSLLSSLGGLNVNQDIRVEATALLATDTYYVALPSVEAFDHLAYIQVKAGNQKGKQVVALEKGSDGRNPYYKASLGKTLKKGEKLDLDIKLIWTQVASPFPKEISQLETQQMYEFLGNAYFYSPYASTEVSHVVKLPNNREPVAWGQEDKTLSASRSGDKITYGPFADVKPLAAKELYLHYQDSSSTLVAKNYLKTVRVSYWSPELHVQEDYELHHMGAKLKGHFSRIDFKLSQYGHHQTTVVKELTAALPMDAKDVYYKDVVGNISTSHFRNEKKRSVLEIKPRFPLYGGWKCNWFQGYTIPNYPVLTPSSSDPGEFKFSLPMTPSIGGLTQEKSTLKVSAPFPVDRESHSTTLTYFDTIGRPTVEIEKHNMVDEYYAPIVITYTYSTLSSWRKPAVIAASLLAIAVALYMVGNLDLAIVPDPKTVLLKRLSSTRKEIASLMTKERNAITKLATGFVEYKHNKNLSAFKAVQASVHPIIESCHTALSTNFVSYGDIGKKSDALAGHLKARMALIKQHHDSVVAFIESKDAENDEKRAALSKQLETFDKALEAVKEKIHAALSQL
ncbi:proteasome regulatory particle base subunit [Kappamyces sp. JEL0829]|nr:proteasome regulatory particle base subunit [Kappamyces sp. JEL0829]